MATTSDGTMRSTILAAGAPRMLRRSCGDGGSRADVGEHHSMTYHERRQLAYLIQPILVLAGVALAILALTSALFMWSPNSGPCSERPRAECSD